MSTAAEKNRQIAKNTMMLYMRTFITMLVSLYTSRIMLEALGVVNFGVNNVVGSIVSMTGIITGVMGAAISRFLTFEIGKGNLERLKTVFSTSINAQIILSVIIVVILEIAGVWFLNTKANIPEGRMVAANWVLQCSIIGIVIYLIASPFNALIIAHERMSIYAYFSIVDVAIKLAICFIIKAYDGDRLILLSTLGLCVSFMVTSFYVWYSHHNFQEARYSPHVFDKPLLKEMTSYSGWNLFGSTAWIVNTQGVNMLVNVFFGVAVNAARGIAGQVNGAIQSFVSNFTTAFYPQVTKSYAAGDIEYAISLANRGTKFTWLMTYIFLVPVFMESETLLKLWLGEVPEYASLFLKFALFESLAVTSGQTLFTLIQATGKIKRYQISVSLFGCLVFPFSWIALKFGAPVWSPYLCFIIIYFSLNIIRFITLKCLMNYSVRIFLKDSLFPCIIVSIASFIVPILIAMAMEPSILRFFIMVPSAVIWTGICCSIFGLSKSERNFFKNKVKQFILSHK